MKKDKPIDNSVLCATCGTYFENKVANAEACVCPNCSRLHVLAVPDVPEKKDVKKKPKKKK